MTKWVLCYLVKGPNTWNSLSLFSILQHPYRSQLLPWIAIKGWKVGPRLEIPPEKTKHSTGETFCFSEVLANGCILHVVTALVVKQQYLEKHDVPEEQGTQTQMSWLLNFKTSVNRWKSGTNPLTSLPQHLSFLTSLQLLSKQSYDHQSLYSCLSVLHCLFCFLVPPRHILPIHYILFPPDSLSQPRTLIIHFLYLHSHLSSKTSLDIRLKPGHPV